MEAELSEQIVGVLRLFPEVAGAWVFGSVARGDARPSSDLDVAVLLGSQGMSVDRQLSLAARLEAAARRPVDLVVASLRDLVLCDAILRDGVLVWEADRERRVDFVSDALVRVDDFMPIWRRAHEGWLEGWRRENGLAAGER